MISFNFSDTDGWHLLQVPNVDPVSVLANDVDKLLVLAALPLISQSAMSMAPHAPQARRPRPFPGH